MTRRLRRALQQFRAFNRQLIELQERRLLRERPWEEDLFHWSFDGHEWSLHGHLPPPARGRRRSTTRAGWCPALVPAETSIDLDQPVG